ncbi:hypothetical protein KHA96_01545 [Bacillus sp. FJAT-49711]|uniref:hypothetical protein n=1 Tax=Bacillus sp. FJAT-49711 TaxID=2833585 RepID=UPI001BCA0116|nr:hypothetical protein [Bacillus sp. FJAT-49711]MBS4216992.1 hypothetical protein [Bacillus sp. FJAT-49711]
MIKKYVSQQKGITLIELLTTLAISTLIIGLTFSVLSTTKKFNDKTQAHVELRQEANIIMSNMRYQLKNKGEVCYDQSLIDDKLALEIYIDKAELKKEKCWTPRNNNEGHVELKLTNKEHNYSFEVDTFMEKQKRENFVINVPKEPIPDPPIKDENFYDYLKNNNIFVYGTDLGIFGSTPVKTDKNGAGTVVINNLNNSNLVFGGNNVLTVRKIYIDKKGNEVKFESSTQLGDYNNTELVRIGGHVQLNNGGAKIYGNTIYIDGNVTHNSSADINGKKVIIDGDVQLNNGAAKIHGDTIYIDGSVSFNDSAEIKGKKVIITGNVTFKNWSAKINANEIYIAGTIIKEQSGNLVGILKNFNQHGETKVIPENIHILPPSFREDSWYSANGYEVRSSGNLTDGSKVFSKNSFKLDDYQSNRRNVIIISKGDITLNNFGSSELTGILFAPNGKVTFKGGAFKGIVIARDGFYTGYNPSITFINVEEFINNPTLAPFK